MDERAALRIHTSLHWKRLTNTLAKEVLSQDYLLHVEPLFRTTPPQKY